MRLSDCLCGPDVANGGGPMSETLQLILVGVAVAGAAGYVVRATWKTWFGKSKPGCGSGCGCGVRLVWAEKVHGRSVTGW